MFLQSPSILHIVLPTPSWTSSSSFGWYSTTIFSYPNQVNYRFPISWFMLLPMLNSARISLFLTLSSFHRPQLLHKTSISAVISLPLLVTSQTSERLRVTLCSILLCVPCLIFPKFISTVFPVFCTSFNLALYFGLIYSSPSILLFLFLIIVFTYSTHWPSTLITSFSRKTLNLMEIWHPPSKKLEIRNTMFVFFGKHQPPTKLVLVLHVLTVL